MTARTLPHDLDAERALLGAAVLDPAGLDAGRAALPEGGRTFYRDLHGKLWNALAELRDQSAAWDEITIKEWLTAAGLWDEIKGYVGLGGLTTCCADWRRAPVYAERVRLLWLQRQAANLAWHAHRAAADSSAKSGDALAACAEQAAELQRLLADAAPRRAGSSFADVLGELLNAAEAGRPVVKTLATGCELLDESGGLACGEYLGLVGSPGVGKTLLADALTLGVLRADADATAVGGCCAAAYRLPRSRGRKRRGRGCITK
ncbi:MAG: hypothetical protein IPM18_12070 [Phycisphaerales bacterium]|nr:hypothetical protein [Phycisphaerales bacterium]